MESLDYTEADAAFDSELVLSESGDFTHIHQSGRFLNKDKLHQQHRSAQPNLPPNNDEDRLEAAVFSGVSEHLKNLRYLKFAREAIASELAAQYCYIDMEYENFSADRCAQLERGEGNTTTTADATATVADPSAYLIAIDEQIPASAVLINARDIEGVQLMITPSDVTLDSSLKQLRKDIERDRIIINGQRVIGAEMGLEKTLDFLGDICDCTLQECGIGKLSSLVRDHYVLTVLSKAARSHSGGIAFQAAQSLIDPMKSILIPQSASTPPLKIIAYVGVFPAVTSNATITDAETHVGTTAKQQQQQQQQQQQRCVRKWGLVCRVMGESIFSIQDFDAPRANDNKRTPAAFRPIEVNTATAAATTIAATATPAAAAVEDELSAMGSGNGKDGGCGLFLGSASSIGSDEDYVKVSGRNTKPASATITSSTCNHDTNSSSCSSSIAMARERISLEHESYISVVYRDYVMFQVKLAAEGEMSNILNLVDDWEHSATVSVCNVEPVYRQLH